jgi:hypothetical protein
MVKEGLQRLIPAPRVGDGGSYEFLFFLIVLFVSETGRRVCARLVKISRNSSSRRMLYIASGRGRDFHMRTRDRLLRDYIVRAPSDESQTT